MGQRVADRKMNQVVRYRPGSDELRERTRGYVMADRINDIVAAPTSKRHNDYLHLVVEQARGESPIDPADEYREKAKILLPRALDAFNIRHDTVVATGLLYYHSEDFQIAAAPDAVWADLVGITVHCRHEEDTYRKAVERGVTNEMRRHAQAMMVVTGLEYWLHLDYFEDAETRTRKLHEHEVVLDKRQAGGLEEDLLGFLLKSRRRAAG